MLKHFAVKCIFLSNFENTTKSTAKQATRIWMFLFMYFLYIVWYCSVVVVVGCENCLLLNHILSEMLSDKKICRHTNVCAQTHTHAHTIAGHDQQWSQLSQEMPDWIKRTDAKNQTLLACSHGACCWLTTVYGMSACVIL